MNQLIAQLQTYFLKQTYLKKIETTKIVDLLMNIERPIPVDYVKIPYPYFQQRFDGFVKNIGTLSTESKSKWNENKSIAFGDSIIDLPRNQFDSVLQLGNFATSGAMSNHMRDMMIAIQPKLIEKLVIPEFVLIGTLGGNSLLQHYKIEQVIEDSILTLNTARQLFPLQRLIILGIPPTVSVYTDLMSMQFEIEMYKWVLNDNQGLGSVYLPMQKKFAGFLGLFPKISMTADGVHQSPNGVYTLDQLIQKGKKSLPKMIID